MTRSIFDPSNPNVERSGDMFTGADARFGSHMPESAIDGVATPGDQAVGQVEFDGTGELIAKAEEVAEESSAENVSPEVT